MNKITKEQAEEWLGIAQSGLIGREYRDVFLRLPEILQSYLAQEEELKEVNDRRMELIAMIEQLKSENQALKERVEAIMQAIKDEPELPGPMPDGMLNDIEKAGIEETMRVVVRETKRGILRRINL